MYDHYTCTLSFSDQDVEKECVPRGKPVAGNIGFITSPNYPAESRFKSCKWNIRVPPGNFAHIFLHEVHVIIFVHPFVTVSFKSCIILFFVSLTNKA